MNSFTISQLARFSGIRQHTIRIWEQRYNALRPTRSAGNTRHYDNSQLRRLLNIVSLSGKDHRVSELCVMKDSELHGLVKQSHQEVEELPREYYISQLILAGLNYDEALFEKLFAHCLLRMPVRDMYVQVIYPLLERLGLMWASDSIHPANEHFVSYLIRQKLFTVIDALPQPAEGAATWLCFLPEDEFHEIGLLFASYLLRSSGRKVIYLGTNVPIESLPAIVQGSKADHLLTFMVNKNFKEATADFVKQLLKTVKQKKIFIAAGEAAGRGIQEKKVQWLKSVSDMEQLLR